MNNMQKLPAAFVHEARLRIFKPSRRPTAEKQTEAIETSYGKIEVEHRAVQHQDNPTRFTIRPLGLAHADLLDSMRQTALDSVIDGAGRLAMLIDPARARRAGGFKCSLHDLEVLLDDMAAAIIKIHEPTRMKTTGHLVDTWRSAEDANGQIISLPCPLARTLRHGSRTARHLWQITIGDVGMQMLMHDLPVDYPLDLIHGLRFGASQAAARWLLGQASDRQPNGGWRLDTVIQGVCGPLGSEDMRNRRREMKEDASAFAALGILILDGSDARVSLGQACNPRLNACNPRLRKSQNV